VLEVGEQAGIVAHGPGWDTVRQAEVGEQTGDLADVPLHRVQPVAPVGDVRGPDVLPRWQQVLHPARDQRAQRDLEWT